MALKSCPRCFREIPEEAKVCPHCNTEVRTCPKCGTLALKDADTCSRCGIKLPKFNPLIESSDVSVDTVVDHVKAFKKKHPIIALLSNQSLWYAISIVLMVAGGIMFLLTINKANLISWDTNSTILMLSIVFEFIAYSLKTFPFVLSEAFVPKMLYKYTENTGVNIIPQLANGAVNIPTTTRKRNAVSTRKLSFDLAKTSEFAKANPGEYVKYMIFNIVRLAVILTTSVGTLVGVGLMALLAPSIVASGANVWTSAPMIVEYIVIVLELSTSIGLNLYMTSFNKARDEWLKTAV